MNSTILINRFQKLPSTAQQEVADFVEFISIKYLPSTKLTKRKPTVSGNFKFNWEDSISEFKNQYTSVELQHKANEWRSI